MTVYDQLSVQIQFNLNSSKVAGNEDLKSLRDRHFTVGITASPADSMINRPTGPSSI